MGECQNVAIVTGGTRGIGGGVAHHLASAHYDLILGYNTNTEAAEETKKHLQEEHGVKVRLVQGDVALPETVNKLFACFEKEFSGQHLTALVHNAGLYVGLTTPPASDEATKASASTQRILGDGTFDDFSKFDYYQQVYPKCFVRLVEGGMKHMHAGGSIVTVSSPGCNANQTPKLTYMLPGQAKASLEYLVRHYALLLAPKHITVNVVVPGFTRTGAWEKLSEGKGGMVAMDKFMEGKCPMKKWMNGKDVGGVVKFLCSPDAAFVTGCCLPVDGGLHLV